MISLQRSGSGNRTRVTQPELTTFRAPYPLDQRPFPIFGLNCAKKMIHECSISSPDENGLGEAKTQKWSQFPCLFSNFLGKRLPHFEGPIEGIYGRVEKSDFFLQVMACFISQSAIEHPSWFLEKIKLYMYYISRKKSKCKKSSSTGIFRVKIYKYIKIMYEASKSWSPLDLNAPSLGPIYTWRRIWWRIFDEYSSTKNLEI